MCSQVLQLSELWVAAPLLSMATLGAMRDAVGVRKGKYRAGALVLPAGGHRLEAAERLGRETVPATVRDCADDRARPMAIDDDMAGAGLSVTDTAVFASERKEVGERLRPDSRVGSVAALHKIVQRR